MKGKGRPATSLSDPSGALPGGGADLAALARRHVAQLSLQLPLFLVLGVAAGLGPQRGRDTDIR